MVDTEKIGQIKEGMIFKNYKEVCMFLDEPFKGGDSKKAQENEWRRYFDWGKKGHKYIVTEIYSTPKEIIEKRGKLAINDKRKGNSGKSIGSRNSNKAKYIKSIESLIMDMLINIESNKSKIGTIFLSKGMMLQELKMVNENYTFCKYRMPKLAKYLNMDEQMIKEWYELTDDMLIRNIEGALNSLNKQCLVLWSKQYAIIECIPIEDIKSTKENRIIKHTHIDAYGEEIEEYELNISKGIYHKHREATEEESKYILQTERNVLLELGCKNKFEVIRFGKWKEFKNKVKDIILKECEFANYYQCYKVLFNENHIVQEFERRIAAGEILNYDYLEEWGMSKEEAQEKKNQLNNDIVKRNLKNATNRQNKAKKELDKMFPGSKIKDDSHGKSLLLRTGENYLNDNQELNSKLIADSNNIKQDVKRTKIENKEENINNDWLNTIK